MTVDSTCQAAEPWTVCATVGVEVTGKTGGLGSVLHAEQSAWRLEGAQGRRPRHLLERSASTLCFGLDPYHPWSAETATTASIRPKLQ